MIRGAMLSFCHIGCVFLSRFVTLPLQELFLTEFLLSEESEISCFSKNVEVNFAKIRPCSDRTCLFCMWFVLSLPKMGCGSAIFAYKSARLLSPFRIFDIMVFR